MGMISGLKKEEAVRFSFLLAIPAILGATLLSIIKMGASDIDMMPLLIGMALSFFISLFAINLIRSLARGNKFHYFSYYCFFMAIVAFILSLKG
jgi:undecaprenyl-diphosphatase